MLVILSRPRTFHCDFVHGLCKFINLSTFHCKEFAFMVANKCVAWIMVEFCPIPFIPMCSNNFIMVVFFNPSNDNFKMCNNVWILGFLLTYHNQWILIHVSNFSFTFINAQNLISCFSKMLP
jgi:hypothetical protein